MPFSVENKSGPLNAQNFGHSRQVTQNRLRSRANFEDRKFQTLDFT
jgi:hypothetical protein